MEELTFFDPTKFPELNQGDVEYIALDAGLQLLPDSYYQTVCPNELHHAGSNDYECKLVVVNNSPTVVCSEPGCAQRCAEVSGILRLRQGELYLARGYRVTSHDITSDSSKEDQ